VAARALARACATRAGVLSVAPPLAPAHALAVFRLDTPRLCLRELTHSDAPFILTLLNDPGWLSFIGDRQVRTLDAARDYIDRAVMAMYERVGHGLWLVTRKPDDEPLGICGLIARDGLADVDLGYALLEAHRGRGYAYEAACASLRYAREVLGLERIVAITRSDNLASRRLLSRLGMTFETTLRLDAEELALFGRTLADDRRADRV